MFDNVFSRDDIFIVHPNNEHLILKYEVISEEYEKICKKFPNGVIRATTTNIIKATNILPRDINLKYVLYGMGNIDYNLKKEDVLKFIKDFVLEKEFELARSGNEYKAHRYVFDSLIRMTNIDIKEIISLYDNHIFKYAINYNSKYSGMYRTISVYIRYFSGYSETDDYLLENEAFVNTYIKAFSEIFHSDDLIELSTFSPIKYMKGEPNPIHFNLKFNKPLIERLYDYGLRNEELAKYSMLLGIPENLKDDRKFIRKLHELYPKETIFTIVPVKYFDFAAHKDKMLGTDTIRYNKHFLLLFLKRLGHGKKTTLKKNVSLFISNTIVKLDNNSTILDVSKLNNMFSSDEVRGFFYRNKLNHLYDKLMLKLFEKSL